MRLGWALNPMTVVLIRREIQSHNERHGDEGHVMMELETGVMCL